MYVNGYLIPVPEANKATYTDIAEKFWEIAQDYGALSQVECWEADVPDGKLTDFRMAVKAEEGEKIVFAWMTWPDKATADASHEKMFSDERMEQFGPEMPFDGKRMIMGGFEPIVWKETQS